MFSLVELCFKAILEMQPTDDVVEWWENLQIPFDDILHPDKCQVCLMIFYPEKLRTANEWGEDLGLFNLMECDSWRSGLYESLVPYDKLCEDCI